MRQINKDKIKELENKIDDLNLQVRALRVQLSRLTSNPVPILNTGLPNYYSQYGTGISNPIVAYPCIGRSSPRYEPVFLQHYIYK